jgi:type IV pilus assembly protein PilW
MVGAPTEFAAEDLVLAVPAERPLPCLLQVEAVRSVDGAQALVNVETGRHAMSQGTLHNLGRAPQALVYAVRAGRLSVCDLLRSDCTRAADVDNPAVWAPVAADVASLRVQYGRDTTVPMDGVVDTWDQQTPTTACGWARVRAVRLVLVARGGAFEREVVTPTAPSWSGSLAAADNVPAPVDLSAQTDWQHFRYRSFETTVPLRNLTWREAVPGC